MAKRTKKNVTSVDDKFHLKHWQIVSLLMGVYDALAIAISYFLGLWFQFNCQFSSIPGQYLHAYSMFIPIYVAVSLVVFWKLKLYNGIWEFASYKELMRTIVATEITFLFHVICITVFVLPMPILYYFIGVILQFGFVIGIRFSYRFVMLERENRRKNKTAGQVNRVLLIGAGSAGRLLLRDIQHTKPITDEVCCVIDDDKNKWGRYLEGILIVGGRDSILLSAEKYKINKIIVAIPSASAEDKRNILTICNKTGCELKNLPGIYQILNGPINMGALKDVAVEDLLGREQISVNMDEIYRYISGKTILVTGGGGSIGSELCRQIAAHHPTQLIVFDIYENNAYEIQQELKEKYPRLNLTVLIGSVRDSKRINSVFEQYRPDIVYHAAAHKHVPLMEDSPCEAIKNNVLGTYKTAYAAMIYDCKRFVLISTDKAVNPTNVMGASKRLCEMVVQSFDRLIKEGKESLIPTLFTHRVTDEEQGEVDLETWHPSTEYVAVRFGNVLGSNGSVIPLFKKQIAKGGPVTVTHQDIIRYFMTIPEAVSLVLQAGAYAHGGEIFVLDMGEPVKIDDLARNLIRLSGYKPGVDIPIVYTGLRPGEKLYEEKLMAEEGLEKTKNDLIHVGRPLQVDAVQFTKQLQELMDRAYANDPGINRLIEKVVSTYHPVHRSAESAEIESEQNEALV